MRFRPSYFPFTEPSVEVDIGCSRKGGELKLGAGGSKPAVVPTITLASPNVRLLGEDAAVVAYMRMTQKLDDAGRPITALCEETRVWQRIDGAWKHVHFHRSLPG